MDTPLLIEALEIAVNSFDYDGEHRKAKVLRAYIEDTKKDMERDFSWGELANFTHEIQVKEFGFCSCEEQESFPYDDCPRKEND